MIEDVKNIKVDSTSISMVVQAVNYLLDNGYKIKNSYVLRKYILFGRKKYFVELEKSKELNMEELQDEIKKAIEIEDYERAKSISEQIINLTQNNQNEMPSM